MSKKPQMRMKAPEGVEEAVIEGHRYEVPEDGIVEVANPNHVATLRRHKFTDCDSVNLEKEVETTDSKTRLVEIIEEHGGDADESMKLSKLRQKARAAIAEDDDEDDDEDEDEKPAKKKKARGKKSKK